jgi:hypothetical protein
MITSTGQVSIQEKGVEDFATYLTKTCSSGKLITGSTAIFPAALNGEQY